MHFFKKKEIHQPDFWREYEATFQEEFPKDFHQVRFVVLDTETTGLDPNKDRVLCIGALSLQNSTIHIKESFEVYLSQYFYHAGNVDVHGILRDEPRECITELEALQQFLSFIGNAVLVAHHAGFDVTMINEALKRHGMPKLKNKVLDTSVLYKRTLLQSPLLQKKEQYSLDELADKFDISKKDRHTALGDAYITAIAFSKILGKLKLKRELTLKWLLK